MYLIFQGKNINDWPERCIRREPNPRRPRARPLPPKPRRPRQPCKTRKDLMIIHISFFDASSTHSSFSSLFLILICNRLHFFFLISLCLKDSHVFKTTFSRRSPVNNWEVPLSPFRVYTLSRCLSSSSNLNLSSLGFVEASSRFVVVDMLNMMEDVKFVSTMGGLSSVRRCTGTLTCSKGQCRQPETSRFQWVGNSHQYVLKKITSCQFSSDFCSLYIFFIIIQPDPQHFPRFKWECAVKTVKPVSGSM